jgi:heme-binding protein/cytochrome P460
MRFLGKLAVAGVAVFALLQLIRPGIPTKPATAEIQAPPEIRSILDKDCYSCHSDQRRLSWFDKIVPGYWLVRSDILTARQHLNFSTIGSKPAAAQRATLFEAVSMVQLGAMPLPQFALLHPEARVTPAELTALKKYLAPWATLPPTADASAAIPTGAPVSLAAVKPELNGLPFEPTFKTWKPISTTDRGDNNSFRFILGNDIAFKAAQSGNISPWPDGARFAKIAWQQQLGPDGLVHPGNFIQVEFMVKNATLYKNTQGWGFGRWRGLDLKPYGEDAHFTNECTGCHQPMRPNDYVYTLPITAVTLDHTDVVNTAAALAANLPWQPLTWNPITMYVDPKTHTTATLYGNDPATQATQTSGANIPAYPAGAILALVTWTQRADPHWFGARIPDAPQSVEFIQVAASGQPASYRHFTGTALTEDHPDPTTAAQRTTFILGLAPAPLP